MFGHKMLSVSIALILLIGLIGFVAVQAQADDTNLADDPWLQKPVLSYLLLTSDERLESEVQTLFEALDFSREEEKLLLAIATNERQEIQALYQKSQATLQDEAHSLVEKQTSIDRYNENVTRISANIDRTVREMLGDRYPAFRNWIRDWWGRERQIITKLKSPQENPSIQSDAYSCWVFATQYNGYTDYEVALPDKYVKFANLDWPIPSPYDTRYNNPPYTVHINRNDNWVWNVLVREVGPWNIDDNYWDTADGSNPRRMFTDIPLCWSEAEYAYYYGYNDGKDQYGRTVTVPCSVDLTPNVAANLGLGYLENR